MRTIYIILFLIGVTLSNCGNQQIKKKSQLELEKEILSELRLDLAQNLDDIDSNITALEISEGANRMMIDHMEHNIPYNDSLDYHFANLYPYVVFAPNETTFNRLINAGFTIISNDSIRRAVSDLYGVQYEIYKSYERIYFVEHYTNYIKPMFISEFTTFKFYRSFKPYNYDQFMKNQDYKRIMSYSADACESFRFLQSNLKENVENLLSAIDKELKQ